MKISGVINLLKEIKEKEPSLSIENVIEIMKIKIMLDNKV